MYEHVATRLQQQHLVQEYYGVEYSLLRVCCVYYRVSRRDVFLCHLKQTRAFVLSILFYFVKLTREIFQTDPAPNVQEIIAGFPEEQQAFRRKSIYNEMMSLLKVILRKRLLNFAINHRALMELFTCVAVLCVRVSVVRFMLT